MAKIDSKVYDQNVLKEGPQFQIDKFYEPQDEQMKRRIRIIMDMVEPEKGGRILDVGCGVGTFAFHCARDNLFSTGMDYSLESVKTAIALCDRFRVSDKAKFIVGSGAGFPFKDCCFDKIIAADFIEHITQEEKGCFLKEAFRVLKPGGKIIVFTPNGIREKIGELYWKLRNVLFNDKIPHTDLHFGLTTKREFEALLKNHSLTFNLHYRDVARPYLASIPLVRSLLALNLIWVIQKEIPNYFPDFVDSCYYFRAAGVRARKVIRSFYLALRHAVLLPFLIFRKIVVFKPEDIKKILVLRYDRIGDMVVSTPVFKALKRKFPESKIIVVASRRNKEIIENDSNVDEVIIYQATMSFICECRKRNIDLCIDLFYTYELKQAFLAFLSGARYRIGFEWSGREIFFNLRGAQVGGRGTLKEHLLELVGCLGIDTKGLEPEIQLRQEEVSWARSYLGAKESIERTENRQKVIAEGDFLASRNIGAGKLRVAVHPGGYYPSQRWPIENFILLSKMLIEKLKVKILAFGDESEKEILGKMRLAMTAGDAEIFIDLSLRQFMAVLSQCQLLICNNSGALHIACALKIPTVSLMGPTDAALWWPSGNNHIVIRKELPCSPCNRGVCREHSCMKAITVEEVEKAVDDLIDKKGGR